MTDRIPRVLVSLALNAAADMDRTAFFHDVVSGPVAPEQSELDQVGRGWIEYRDIEDAVLTEIRLWLSSHPRVLHYSIIRDWSELYPDLLAMAERMKSDGRSIDEVVSVLRGMCPSPIQSIKVVRSAFAIPMSEAKDRVHNSVVWADRRDEFEALHDVAEGAADELSRNR